VPGAVAAPNPVQTLSRYTLEELEGLVAEAERLVPGTAAATAAALRRKTHPARPGHLRPYRLQARAE